MLLHFASACDAHVMDSSVRVCAMGLVSLGDSRELALRPSKSRVRVCTRLGV